MKNVVVLSGAGMSAESGLKTFRDSDGLWEGYDVMEVASYDGWMKNPELVNSFYNDRRSQLSIVEPNAGHFAIKDLEEAYNTTVITQNVDDLHERAGSKNIIHLHGELTKLRSSKNNDLYEIGYQKLKYGSLCPKGGLLRPHIVWFGELVPMMERAVEMVKSAHILIVVGTSLEVYPAASLIDFVQTNTEIYLIDPNRHQDMESNKLTVIKNTAAKALPQLVNRLINLCNH
ncbi:MAG: Sir2 family NAD-dependent protein deacetylase [Bacteroidia bacterium]